MLSIYKSKNRKGLYILYYSKEGRQGYIVFDKQCRDAFRGTCKHLDRELDLNDESKFKLLERLDGLKRVIDYLKFRYNLQ